MPCADARKSSLRNPPEGMPTPIPAVVPVNTKEGKIKSTTILTFAPLAIACMPSIVAKVVA
ncbi:MAG: hypothetical protein PHT26_16065, partial [Lentimicrobiaceae bacterium]|nr:hypothetical protein [Lentimicrobiaceae bacterium]